nr:hypothetical protein [Streptomyces sp. TLI_235]
MSESERDPVRPGWAALTGEGPVLDRLVLTPPDDLDHPAMVVDASRSLFEVDPDGLAPALAADLATAG